MRREERERGRGEEGKKERKGRREKEKGRKQKTLDSLFLITVREKMPYLLDR